MTDVPSVAAAYVLVVGGLGLYVVSIARRLRAAQRTSEAIRREREHESRPVGSATSSVLVPGRTEPPG